MHDYTENKLVKILRAAAAITSFQMRGVGNMNPLCSFSSAVSYHLNKLSTRSGLDKNSGMCIKILGTKWTEEVLI